MSAQHRYARTAVSRAIALGVPIATTAALLLSGLVGAGVAQATTSAAETITVTPPSGLLDTSETRALGHNDFLEDGLHVWTEDASSLSKAAGYLAQVESLSSLAAAGEPTLDWTPDPGLTAIPGKQVVVDFDDADGPDGILVGEPVYGDNWWLSNSAETFVKTGAPHEGGGYGSAWYGTLAEWSDAFPSAQVAAVGYSMGSGVHGGGVISSMTYGDTTYEFALGVGPCEALIDAPTLTYRLTEDCSTFQTINIPDGWTIDGDGNTLTAVEDATSPNFPGPIIVSATGTEAGPATLHVSDLTINTTFSGANSGGLLAGIRFNQAGGSVTDVEITGVTHGNGVQEGIALYVRNKKPNGDLDVPEATVTVDGVTVTRYQKSGVIFDGNVSFSMTDSTVGRSTDQAGNPIPGIAANAVQISRGAHGAVTGSTIALNDYNPSPPPGDGSSSTAILVYNAAEVSLSQSLVTGTNGDIGMDTYNDGTGSFDTVVNASCNLFERDDDGAYDPYGIGISQWDDGSDPVEVNLSDTTFSGWNYDTALLDGAPPALEVQPGAENQQLGACVPSAPVVSATGGDEVADVTWTPSSAPAYAPISGYEVTLSGDDTSEETQLVDADVTSAQFEDLTSGVTYTASVVALNASGESAPGTATLFGTDLTLAPDDPSVKFKQSTIVRGTLSSADSGADLAGRTITVEARPNGASGWSAVGTATTAADGSYELSVSPAKHTAYRAQYAGGPDMPSTSGPATVYVKVKVTMKTADKTVAEGTTVQFAGKASPKLKGKPVQLERKIGSTWVEVDAGTLNNVSRYKFFWDAQLGTSEWRVVVPGTSDLLKGISKPITMIVS